MSAILRLILAFMSRATGQNQPWFVTPRYEQKSARRQNKCGARIVYVIVSKTESLRRNIMIAFKQVQIDHDNKLFRFDSNLDNVRGGPFRMCCQNTLFQNYF